MHSILRRLFIAAVLLGAIALILLLADVELAQHHDSTHTVTTSAWDPSVPVPAHPTLFVYVPPTEPPALRTNLSKPLSHQLEARGMDLQWLERPPNADERPALTLSLHAAPMTWTPFHANATVTVRMQLLLKKGPPPSDPFAPHLGGELRLNDVTSGLTSRPAYLRILAEASASGIAQTLTQLLDEARPPAQR